MKSKFLFQYCLTILDIIESRNSRIPLFVYQTMIAIHFFCFAGYIHVFELRYVLSTFEIKPLNDSKIYALGAFNEISCFTFILLRNGMDYITEIFFIILDVSVALYYAYVGIYTYLRMYQKGIFEYLQRYLQQINQLMNLFFTSFWWLFYSPYIDINSGMSVVGPTSYLIKLRDQTDYNNKPIWQIVLGPTFICLVTLLGGILIYSFRNYEFLEENYLKRRFVYSQIFMLSIRNLLIISFYINFPYILEIKHMCIHIIGFSLIIDLYSTVPYTNEGTYYEVAVTCASIWIFTDFLGDYEMLFIILVFVPLIYGVGIKAFRVVEYEIYKNTASGEFEDNYDQGIEYLYQTYNESISSSHKFINICLISQHRQVCVDVLCPCQIKQANVGVLKNLVEFCDYDLKKVIKRPETRASQGLLEHFNLKLISFIAKAKQNVLLSFYELKKIQYKTENPTLYFRLITLIISKQTQKNIKSLMKLNQESLAFVDETIKVQKKMFQIDDIIKHALKDRIWFLRSAQLGFKKLPTFIKMVKSCDQTFIKSLGRVDLVLNRMVSKYNHLNQHLFILKTKQLLEQFLRNDLFQAYQLGIQIKKIIDRDKFQYQKVLNNHALSKSKVMMLQVSMSNEFTKVLNLSEISEKQFQKYFQCSKTEYDFKSVMQLIPQKLQSMSKQTFNRLLREGDIQFLTQNWQFLVPDRDKYLFLSSLDFRINFNVVNDVVLWMALTRVTTNKEFIVLDKHGDIMGISRTFFTILNKTSDVKPTWSLQEFMEMGNIFMMCKNLIYFFEKVQRYLEYLSSGTIVNNFYLLMGREMNMIYDEEICDRMTVMKHKFYSKLKSNYFSTNQRLNLTKLDDLKSIRQTIKQELTQKKHEIIQCLNLNFNITFTCVEELQFFTIEINSFKKVRVKDDPLHEHQHYEKQEMQQDFMLQPTNQTINVTADLDLENISDILDFSQILTEWDRGQNNKVLETRIITGRRKFNEFDFCEQDFQDIIFNHLEMSDQPELSEIAPESDRKHNYDGFHQDVTILSPSVSYRPQQHNQLLQDNESNIKVDGSNLFNKEQSSIDVMASSDRTLNMKKDSFPKQKTQFILPYLSGRAADEDEKQEKQAAKMDFSLQDLFQVNEQLKLLRKNPKVVQSWTVTGVTAIFLVLIGVIVMILYPLSERQSYILTISEMKQEPHLLIKAQLATFSLSFRILDYFRITEYKDPTDIYYYDEAFQDLRDLQQTLGERDSSCFPVIQENSFRQFFYDLVTLSDIVQGKNFFRNDQISFDYFNQLVYHLNQLQKQEASNCFKRYLTDQETTLQDIAIAYVCVNNQDIKFFLVLVVIQTYNLCRIVSQSSNTITAYSKITKGDIESCCKYLEQVMHSLNHIQFNSKTQEYSSQMTPKYKNVSFLQSVNFEIRKGRFWTYGPVFVSFFVGCIFAVSALYYFNDLNKQSKKYYNIIQDNSSFEQKLIRVILNYRLIQTKELLSSSDAISPEQLKEYNQMIQEQNDIILSLGTELVIFSQQIATALQDPIAIKALTYNLCDMNFFDKGIKDIVCVSRFKNIYKNGVITAVQQAIAFIQDTYSQILSNNQSQIIQSTKYKGNIQYFFLATAPVLGFIMDDYEYTVRDFELSVQIKYMITITVLGVLSLIGVQIIFFLVRRRDVHCLLSLRNTLSLFPLEVMANRLTISLLKSVSKQ